MKKITLVTMQLKTPGGIERFVSTLAGIFADDYEVEIVANYGRPTDMLAFPLHKNVKVTFLGPVQPKEISLKTIILKFKWHQIIPEFKRRKTINSSRDKAFKEYFQSLKTDCIITDRALYSSLVAKHYHGDATLIATDHNDPHGNYKYIHNLLKSIKRFDYLVIATEKLKSIYASKTKAKCVVIKNPLPNIPTKKSPLGTKNIIAVGRLVPEKDFSLLISAMAIVNRQDPNIHLDIIGDGVEKDRLQKQIKNLDLEKAVSLTGWLPQEQIAKYYYNSSLFALTSREEAFGLVLAEAMSYGVPCIALSRASGACAQITKETGILIKNPDPFVIADKILQSLTDQEYLKSLQLAINKEIDTKYSKKTIKEKWEKLLNS